MKKAHQLNLQKDAQICDEHWSLTKPEAWKYADGGSVEHWGLMSLSLGLEICWQARVQMYRELLFCICICISICTSMFTFMFVLVFVVLVQTGSCLWAWGSRYADKPRSRCSSRPIARRPDKPTCLVASEPNAKFDSFIRDFQQQQHRCIHKNFAISCFPCPKSKRNLEPCTFALTRCTNNLETC